MSLGGNFDKYEGNSRYERYLIQGEAGRAGEAAKAVIGYKSLFRRLRERIWPAGQKPGDGSGTFPVELAHIRR